MTGSAKERPARSGGSGRALVIGLNAAIVSLDERGPAILIVPSEGGLPQGAGEASRWVGLPFGPFDPLTHRTLEIGLRAWVKEQTGLGLGYVEQLYTFGDRGRHARQEERQGEHVVSVGYLALTRQPEGGPRRHWRGWYDFFPWEDWREAEPKIIAEAIAPRLRDWAARQENATAEELARGRRLDRIRLCFGLDGVDWDDEKVLERFELLYEAGLVQEAARDGRPNAAPLGGMAPLGEPMQFDHRRILATAISRLRGKLKYRPVVFELMPPSFTLYKLQQGVEALLGQKVHKQNFRRLVEKAGLVEGTGKTSTSTGGRPAELFRFRREVLNERPAPGLRLAPTRSRANR